MFKSTSRMIKLCAYIFLFGFLIHRAYDIAMHTSYLNTGELMGVQSMLSMLWSCFLSFMFSLMIYGVGIIVSYYEKSHTLLNQQFQKQDDIYRVGQNKQL